MITQGLDYSSFLVPLFPPLQLDLRDKVRSKTSDWNFIPLFYINFVSRKGRAGERAGRGVVIDTLSDPFV